MKIIKYFFEFIFVYTLFIIFKIIGYKAASSLGEKIGILIGPFFRSKKKIEDNLKNSNIGSDDLDRKKIIKKMWGNWWIRWSLFCIKFKNNEICSSYFKSSFFISKKCSLPCKK